MQRVGPIMRVFELELTEAHDKVSKILLPNKHYCVSSSGRIKLQQEGYNGKVFISFVNSCSYIWLPLSDEPTTLTVTNWERIPFTVYVSEA